MNEQAVASCRGMGFDELAAFIRNCLERMDDPDPGWDRPHTKDDFLVVWRLLREKSDSRSASLPHPRNLLQKAYAKRLRTEELLYDEAPGNPKFSKKDRYQMERTLDRLDREIEEMRASGQYPPPPAPSSEVRQRGASRIASEVFAEIENAFQRRPSGRRLQWRPGRSGSLSVASIGRYCAERQRRDPEFKYDMGRIEKAYELGPDGLPWEGPDGFDGYVIFTFPGTKKALMECPEIGNAAYVIHKGWESWSLMDKQELMAEAERGGEVTRIPHQGDDWPTKVRRALDLE